MRRLGLNDRVEKGLKDKGNGYGSKIRMRRIRVKDRTQG